MGTFLKRETKREIFILGHKYTVDFGRDHLAFIFKRVQVELGQIEKKDRGDLGQEVCFYEMQNEEKAVLKGAIEEILDCSNEELSIFEDEDTIVLHRDIYTYLVEEYINVMKTRSPYTIERIEGL
ncbi:hypothetical protein [Anaerotignum sp.]|uniref:hypothetical protein n=1 Tax=Anaerotignum sp. TaxID=2039241 RepID=UPI00289ECDC9|nr:hypothetical protein [Anaerotignum sp.]